MTGLGVDEPPPKRKMGWLKASPGGLDHLLRLVWGWFGHLKSQTLCFIYLFFFFLVGLVGMAEPPLDRHRDTCFFAFSHKRYTICYTK
jgi:hypothetical protein